MGKRKTKRFDWPNPSLLVFILPFILLARVWLTGRALYWGTPGTQFIPWWWQAWRTFQAGEWPLWNPMLGMGAPLLANYQSAIFYPPNWIYFVFAAIGGLPLMAWGQAILVSAHLAFAGWGMLKLLQKLGLSELAQVIGALAFSLSGYLVARAHFLSISSTVAWLPWILLATYELTLDKKPTSKLFKLSLFLAFQWLAGHAQTSWYTILLATAWLIFWIRRTKVRPALILGRFLAAAAFAFALSAVQLIPTAEYLLRSQRALQYDPTSAMAYSFWPWRALTLLAPNLFGNPARGDYWGYGNFWEDAVYIGLLPLLLAFSTWRTKQNIALARFLTLVTLASFVLAMGDHLPIFPWLYAHVPSFAAFQAPARFSLWAVISLSILAAIGANAWGKPSRNQLYWVRLSVAGTIAIVIAGGITLALSIARFAGLQRSFGSSTILFGLTALAICILVLKTPANNRARNIWAWAAILIVSFDLLYAGWGLNPAGSLALYAPSIADPEVEAGRIYISEQDEHELKFNRFFRFDSFLSSNPDVLRVSLLPNIGLLAQIPSANNFDPLVPARYADWMTFFEKQPAGLKDEMLAAMAVGQVETIAEDGSLVFTELDHLGRVRWVGCAIPVSDARAAFDLLQTSSFDFQSSVVIEDPQDGRDTCASGVGTAQILQQTANTLLISANADSPGWLILADTWFPGWFAKVDGVAREIYPAYGIFRAVEVHEGSSTIEIAYRPVSFSSGLVLSALAWPVYVVLQKKFSND